MLNGDNGTVKMRLTDQVVQSFHVIKEFPEISSKINAINFSTNGGLLISSDQDDQIVLYDCDIGKQKYTINSRKYGVDLIHFTPDAKNVVHSSTKVDDAIRYLSLNSKTYLHYFRGHTKKVISLCISPKKDGLSFLSGSMDNTLRLWDVRLSTCHGVMRSAGRPIAAYDPEGVIFAAGINSENIKLYDLRSFDKGPFITFHLNRERDCDWTGMKFSGDGKKILINTNGRVTRLVDAFNGTLLHTFAVPSNNAKLPNEASFSPDSQYIFAGSVDDRIHVWNVQNGKKVCALNGNHRAPVQCVQFNPMKMLLASASTSPNLTFWLPQPENLPQ